MYNNMIAEVVSRGVRIDGKDRDIGETFNTSDYPGRDWLGMQARGQVTLLPDKEEVAAVAPADSEGSSEASASGSPYLGLSRNELLQVLQDRGFSESDVPGTGSRGYVTVDDIVAALETIDAG